MQANKLVSLKFGKWAETYAKYYLICKGYRVVVDDYNSPIGQIDLIIRKGKQLIFVEVKARKYKYQFDDAISPYQQQRINNSAELFISKNQKYDNYVMRFDAVFIRPWRLPVHLKGAW